MWFIAFFFEGPNSEGGNRGWCTVRSQVGSMNKAAVRQVILPSLPSAPFHMEFMGVATSGRLTTMAATGSNYLPPVSWPVVVYQHKRPLAGFFVISKRLLLLGTCDFNPCQRRKNSSYLCPVITVGLQRVREPHCSVVPGDNMLHLLTGGLGHVLMYLATKPCQL